MPVLRVSGATRDQKRVLRLLHSDLCTLGISLPKSFRIDFDPKALDGDEIGLYLHDDGHVTILLDPSLQDGDCYYIAAHEVGHALGLDHTRGGLMAAVDRTQNRRELTLRRRRKWMRQLSQGLVAHRLSKLEDVEA